MKKRKYIVEISVDVETETIDGGKNDVEDLIKMTGLFKNYTVRHYKERRTEQQGKALELWLDWGGAHCADRGLTAESLFKAPADLPITKHMLKDFFRMLGQTMFKKDSTASLTVDEMSEVVEVAKREFSSRIDFHEEFPSEEGLMNKGVDYNSSTC